MGGGVKRISNSMGGGGKTQVPSKAPIFFSGIALKEGKIAGTRQS